MRVIGGEGAIAPVEEISADADHGDVLAVEVELLEGVSRLRMETVAVDGWVIIHEIRALEG